MENYFNYEQFITNTDYNYSSAPDTALALRSPAKPDSSWQHEQYK